MSPQTKNRLTLIGLFLLFFTPVCLAVLMNSTFFQFKPNSTRNYGELLKPVVTVALPYVGFEQSAPKNAWWLIYANAGACTGACARDIKTLHQLHVAVGRDFDRIGVRFFPTSPELSEALPPDVIRDMPPTTALKIAMAQAIPSVNQNGWLVLMDPLGNILMRYPPGFDATGVRKDLHILLKFSPLGK